MASGDNGSLGREEKVREGYFASFVSILLPVRFSNEL